MADTQDAIDLGKVVASDANDIAMLARYVVTLTEGIIMECGPTVIHNAVAAQLMAERIGLLADLLARKAGDVGSQRLEDWVLPGAGLRVSAS